MSKPSRKNFLFVFLAAVLLPVETTAQNLDLIGVTLLRAMTTNVNGAGIRVAQPEAGTPYFEVNPANVGQPVALFTYISSVGSATTYTNTVGTNSGHADAVGNNFYGMPNGVATNVAHVDNYEVNYFYNSLIDAAVPTNLDVSVVNQSFIFDNITVGEQQDADSAYDNYAAQFSTLFVSGAGNGGPVNAPATCYNGIGVGVSDGPSSYGPTLDNGRSKPDIVAPGGVTSLSTPYVAGAAAALMQAALRGDGGGDTNSAADIRTVKALLLNGAVKPIGWSNSLSAPLDRYFGAGLLNVFNSYEQLAFGKHGYVSSASVNSGSPHPPDGGAGMVGALSGWDFDSISSSSIGPFSTDGVNHYYFNVTDGGNGAFAATATLVWNRPASASSAIHADINDLNLFLYNAADSNLVACSTSVVDNVEHIFVPRLAPGRYDLQVWKSGGSGFVSASENYALAWEFVAPRLNLAKSGATATASWPVYPAGFGIETATNLAAIWRTNNLPAVILANGTNLVQIPMTNGAQFFRLRQPNF